MIRFFNHLGRLSLADLFYLGGLGLFSLGGGVALLMIGLHWQTAVSHHPAWVVGLALLMVILYCTIMRLGIYILNQVIAWPGRSLPSLTLGQPVQVSGER